MVTAYLMLKKLVRDFKQNGRAKALRKIGRIEQTLFMFDLLRNQALRTGIQADGVSSDTHALRSLWTLEAVNPSPFEWLVIGNPLNRLNSNFRVNGEKSK